MKNRFLARSSVHYPLKNEVFSGMNCQISNLADGTIMSCCFTQSNKKTLENNQNLLNSKGKIKNKNLFERDALAESLENISLSFSSDLEFRQRNIFQILKAPSELVKSRNQINLNPKIDKEDSNLIRFGDLILIKAHEAINPDQSQGIFLRSSVINPVLNSQGQMVQTPSLSHNIDQDSLFRVCPLIENLIDREACRNLVRLTDVFMLQHVKSGRFLSGSAKENISCLGSEMKAVCKSPQIGCTDRVLEFADFGHGNGKPSNFYQISHFLKFRVGTKSHQNFDGKIYSQKFLIEKANNFEEILIEILAGLYERSKIQERHYLLPKLRQDFLKIDAENLGNLSQEDFHWGLKMNKIQVSESGFGYLCDFYKADNEGKVDYHRFCNNLRGFTTTERTKKIRDFVASRFAEIFEITNGSMKISQMIDNVGSEFLNNAESLDRVANLFSAYSKICAENVCFTEMTECQIILLIEDFAAAFVCDNALIDFLENFFKRE